MDKLPPLLGDESDDGNEAAFTTAAALSLAFGWRFFHPYIRAALKIDDSDFAISQAAMRERVHTLIKGTRVLLDWQQTILTALAVPARDAAISR